jgi:GNAT superfamily N-acetyltransferase
MRVWHCDGKPYSGDKADEARMSFKFEPAVQADEVPAERVMRAAFTPMVHAYGRELAPDAHAWFPAAIEAGRIYVARDGEAIVGLVVTTRREAELVIDQIAVDPSRQRAGIGAWLLDRVDEMARRTGMRMLSLYTGEMFTHLVPFYEQHGFRIVRRGPPPHGKDAHTRVFMEKRLER